MTTSIKAVHKLAADIVKRFRLVPPVDIFSIYDKYGIDIVEMENQYGIEAYSELGNEPKVYINPEMTHYSARKRFTLAHELGHVVIPWHNGDIKGIPGDHYVKVNNKLHIDSQELEANIFASDILMPVDWLKGVIHDRIDGSFESLVRFVSSEADTSIAAVFYALRYALPSGFAYCIYREPSNWFEFFFSKNTYTVKWRSFYEDIVGFFEEYCLSKEEFNIKNYEGTLYRMMPCPDKESIQKKYHDLGDSLDALINNITYGDKRKCLLYLDAVLSSIEKENSLITVYMNGSFIKSIASSNYVGLENISYVFQTLDEMTEVLSDFGFKFEIIKIDPEIDLLYVLDKFFYPPQVSGRIDERKLLNEILEETGCSDRERRVINGVIGGLNSTSGEITADELYNRCIHSILSKKELWRLYFHEKFGQFLIEKCRKIWRNQGNGVSGSSLQL